MIAGGRLRICVERLERDDFGCLGLGICDHNGLVALIDLSQGLTAGFKVDQTLREELMARHRLLHTAKRGDVVIS